MLHDTPLRSQHDAWLRTSADRATDAAVAEARPGAAVGRRDGAEILWLPYGPRDEAGEATCEIPGTFGGDVEAEYAAIRRGAGLIDAAHRGTIVMRGDERLEYLDRLVTNAVGSLRIGAVCETFLTNRKGRIEADLLLVQLSDQLIIDVDVHQAAAVYERLDATLFGEDVQLEDATASRHRIGIHGRRALDVLAALTAPIDVRLDHLTSGRIMVDGVEVVIVRRDQTGEPGLECIVTREGAEVLWARLLEVDATLGGRRTIRPCGWYAWNMARVEAGTPLFNVDFGTNALPHETGLLRRRVSFTKGCYPGQEVVARTEHLGRPKQTIVGLIVDGDEEPVAGGQVFLPGDGDGGRGEGAVGAAGVSKADAGSAGDAGAGGDASGAAGGDASGDASGAAGDDAGELSVGAVVGTVTSSAPSPMRGLEPVALATIKSKHAEAGQRVVVVAAGTTVAATVGPLAAWSGGSGVVADAVEGAEEGAAAEAADQAGARGPAGDGAAGGARNTNDGASSGGPSNSGDVLGGGAT